MSQEAERNELLRANGESRSPEASTTPQVPLTRRAMRAMAAAATAAESDVESTNATAPSSDPAESGVTPTEVEAAEAIPPSAEVAVVNDVPAEVVVVTETPAEVVKVEQPMRRRRARTAPVPIEDLSTAVDPANEVHSFNDDNAIAVDARGEAVVIDAGVDAQASTDSSTESSIESSTDEADEINPNESTDAFERAARLFAFSGDEITKDELKIAPVEEAVEDPTSEYFGSEPRKARSNFRKIATAGFSVSVMGVIGAFALSMSMPFMGASAQMTPLQASAEATAPASDEIQAFVASSDVQNSAVDRSADYTEVSAAQIAAQDGIIYSNSVFTNDTSAAIQWPFEVGVGMSYGYGMRDGRLHEGIDFTPGNGAPIQAIADGTVRIATENGGAYGVTVYIDHIIDGELITSHYSHMQYGSIKVKEGQQVKVGDAVGLTGNTGRSFGAHLHFELIVNGSTIDPMPWLQEHAG